MKKEKMMDYRNLGNTGLKVSHRVFEHVDVIATFRKYPEDGHHLGEIYRCVLSDRLTVRGGKLTPQFSSNFAHIISEDVTIGAE